MHTGMILSANYESNTNLQSHHRIYESLRTYEFNKFYS